MIDLRRNRRWRLLFAPPGRGAENMARDIALLRRARESGESVFSVYGWSSPTLSFGRNQRAKGCYDPELMRKLGVDVVRRPTGGRALLHNREVTYSVTAQVGPGETLRDSCDRINNILLDGLGRLGVKASVAAPETRATRPTEAPCFATPSRGEVIAGGRKLVGSAQWREDGALLQHGSILIEDDQSMILNFTYGSNEKVPIPTPATLADTLGRSPAADEIADALFDAVREREDPGALQLDESAVRPFALAELAAFENELWTWRR